jgi:HAMP domain-containing protein
MGFIFMIVMIVMVFRMFSERSGMCGFGRHDEVEDLKKEVRELRSEIEALRKAK